MPTLTFHATKALNVEMVSKEQHIISQKQISQRQVAALSVEHDELSKKVEEMKLFLSQNEHGNSFIADE